MRKRRTREHVVSDLSVNHVERFVLRAGHVADRVLFDYGYDLTLRTFTDDGQIEQGFLYVQLKASDAVNYIQNEQFLSLRMDRRDAELWRVEQVPVILVVYDASKDRAYWLHYQTYENAGDVMVRIPTNQQIDEAAIEQLRRMKNETLKGTWQ
ncbi:MAG: DUF4365 domain-containing protein [Akkermansiaceae bacterium]|nr:DUF4365 domain-containing protein [Armatimonadota bacterium]